MTNKELDTELRKICNYSITRVDIRLLAQIGSLSFYGADCYRDIISSVYTPSVSYDLIVNRDEKNVIYYIVLLSGGYLRDIGSVIGAVNLRYWDINNAHSGRAVFRRGIPGKQ